MTRTAEVYTLDENKKLNPHEVYFESDIIKVTVLLFKSRENKVKKLFQ